MDEKKRGYLKQKDGTKLLPVSDWNYLENKPDTAQFVQKKDVDSAYDKSDFPKLLENDGIKKLISLQNGLLSLKSPDGQWWKLVVDNNGNLSTTKE